MRVIDGQSPQERMEVMGNLQIILKKMGSELVRFEGRCEERDPTNLEKLLVHLIPNIQRSDWLLVCP